MPTPYSNDQIQNLHPIYLPVRVANLNALSIEDELNAQRFLSTLIIVWGGSGYIDINEVHQKVVTGNAGELYRAWMEPQKNSPFAVQYLFMKLLEELYMETSKKHNYPQVGLNVCCNI